MVAIKTNGLPTIERLRELLIYDPESGLVRWRVARKNMPAGHLAGYSNIRGKYQTIGIDYGKYSLHRVAWALHYGEWPNGLIDHANMDVKDNRISNLRMATKSQNVHNSVETSRSTSGYRCVTWNKQRKKWMVRVMVDGKINYLGLYENPEDASKAYLEFMHMKLGEFARVK